MAQMSNKEKAYVIYKRFVDEYGLGGFKRKNVVNVIASELNIKEGTASIYYNEAKNRFPLHNDEERGNQKSSSSSDIADIVPTFEEMHPGESLPTPDRYNDIIIPDCVPAFLIKGYEKKKVLRDARNDK